MESVIAEHLSSIEDYRNLSLIFDIEPIFIKDEDIKLFDLLIFLSDENEGIYLNELREGNWIYWFRNGQKQAEGNYQNGLEEGSGAYGEAGLWVGWWSNGQKESEGHYRNGKEEGLWKFWNENGQNVSEYNYQN